MKSYWRFSVLLLVMAGMFTGCSSGGVSALESISATLVDVRTDAAGPAGAQGIMTVRYDNQSILPIGLSTVEHRLYLNGQLAGKATSERPIALPSSSAVNQEIPFSLESTLPSAGQVQYRLETVLTVMAGTQRLRSRSQSEGAVQLR